MTLSGFQNITFHFTCLSSVNLVESQRYGLVKTIQIPHTYSVSQPRPGYVYMCSNRHLTDTRIHGYIPVFHHFYALNFWQSPSIIKIFRIQVHEGTPPQFCHTTTVIVRVSVHHSRSIKHQTQFTVYARISQIRHVYLPSTYLNHRDTDWSTPQRYHTHTLSHNH